MAQAQYRSLSKRVVDRLSVNGKDAIFWIAISPVSAFESTRAARKCSSSRRAPSAARSA